MDSWNEAGIEIAARKKIHFNTLITPINVEVNKGGFFFNCTVRIARCLQQTEINENALRLRDGIIPGR